LTRTKQQLERFNTYIIVPATMVIVHGLKAMFIYALWTECSVLSCG